MGRRLPPPSFFQTSQTKTSSAPSAPFLTSQPLPVSSPSVAVSANSNDSQGRNATQLSSEITIDFRLNMLRTRLRERTEAEREFRSRSQQVHTHNHPGSPPKWIERPFDLESGKLGIDGRGNSLVENGKVWDEKFVVEASNGSNEVGGSELRRQQVQIREVETSLDDGQLITTRVISPLFSGSASLAWSSDNTTNSDSSNSVSVPAPVSTPSSSTVQPSIQTASAPAPVPASASAPAILPTSTIEFSQSISFREPPSSQPWRISTTERIDESTPGDRRRVVTVTGRINSSSEISSTSSEERLEIRPNVTIEEGMEGNLVVIEESEEDEVEVEGEEWDEEGEDEEETSETSASAGDEEEDKE
jgi:hypothetical protein